MSNGNDFIIELLKADLAREKMRTENLSMALELSCKNRGSQSVSIGHHVLCPIGMGVIKESACYSCRRGKNVRNSDRCWVTHFTGKASAKNRKTKTTQES